ncbi:MAG: DUF89 family protein [Candidatus Hydrogenedentes bacterium]|nr:DUF89 family protein [Candidatus Hydrogenedentota bacterium]
MRSFPECVPCIIDQGLRAARIATDDERIHEEVVREIVRRLKHFDFSLPPAVNSMIGYDAVAAITGDRDPFRAIKREHNEAALAVENDLNKIVKRASDKLHCALRLCCAGNVIDMGTQKSLDIAEVVDNVARLSFAVDDYAEFLESLSRADEVLIVADNAGEIVFDKPLVRELSRHARVFYAVKSGPILDDATMEDAEQTGMNRLATVVTTGTSTIGAPPKLVSDEFRELVERAGLIIAKGQGNFETLDVLPQDIFFILKAKCPLVAGQMGVRFGEMGLISNRKRLRRRRAE